MPASSDVLVQYGALGVLAIACLLAVKAMFQVLLAVLRGETERANRTEEALRELERAVREQVVPAAVAMADTAKALIEQLAQERARHR